MLLRINKLSHRVEEGSRQRLVLDNLELELQKGQSLTLEGLSENDASILINLIAGLDTIQSGYISVHGTDIKRSSTRTLSHLRRRQICVMYHEQSLIEALTLADNIALYAKLSERYQPRLCRDLTQRLQLQEVINHYPAKVTPYQRQKALLARAIASGNSLILAVAPSQGLSDYQLNEYLSLMVSLCQQYRLALLLCSNASAPTERKVSISISNKIEADYVF